MDTTRAEAENAAAPAVQKPALDAAPRRGLAERAPANVGSAAPAFTSPTDTPDGEPEFVSKPTAATVPLAAPSPWDCGFAAPLPSRARLRAAGAWLAAGPALAALMADAREDSETRVEPPLPGAALARARQAPLGEEEDNFLAAAASGAVGAWVGKGCGEAAAGEEDTRWGGEGGLLAEGGDAASATLATFSLGAFA